jgi:hypothetical protein
VLEGLIGLSDQQMDTIVWATAPLTPRERALFWTWRKRCAGRRSTMRLSRGPASRRGGGASEREADCAQQARCWHQRPAAGGKFDGLLG